MEVLYGSPSFFDLQVIAAVKHDAVLAAISAGLVIILMFILSGFSIWLTFAGLYSIISCFVPAYFCYRVIFSEFLSVKFSESQYSPPKVNNLPQKSVMSTLVFIHKVNILTWNFLQLKNWYPHNEN